MAPGNNVWVANPGGGYGTTSGTSFSCPYTAGVAACALGANPAMSWQQIMECVSQADDAGAPGYDTLWGWGRINAEKAVSYARSIQGNGNEPPPPDTTPPTISFNSPANGLVITQDQNIAVSVTAKDNTEVTKVVFWMNQFEYLTDTDGSSDLYGWNWNTQGWTDGPWTIRAVAYDAAGNSAEASVTVTLNRTGGDTQGPSLTIVNPKDGFTVSGSRLVVDMTFSDNVKVTQIVASIPSQSATRDNPTSPLKFNFNVRKVPAGAFTLTVKARDEAGNETVKTVNLTKK
jgi:thermitase